MKAKVKNWPENRAVDFRLCQCFNMEGLPSRGWRLLSLRISEEMVARNLDVPVIEVVNSQRTIVFPSGKPATTHLGGVASDHFQMTTCIATSARESPAYRFLQICGVQTSAKPPSPRRSNNTTSPRGTQLDDGIGN